MGNGKRGSNADGKTSILEKMDPLRFGSLDYEICDGGSGRGHGDGHGGGYVMIVLMDVDGVVADFVGGVLNELHDRGIAKDKDLVSIGPRHMFDYLSDEEAVVARQIINAPGFAQRLGTVPGARYGVEQLVSMGFQVVFLTAPWDDSPTWCYDRTKWLEAMFPYDCSIIFTHAKWHVKGDLFLDDYLPNLVKWDMANSGKAFLFNTQGNQDLDSPFMRTSWGGLPLYLGHPTA